MCVLYLSNGLSPNVWRVYRRKHTWKCINFVTAFNLTIPLRMCFWLLFVFRGFMCMCCHYIDSLVPTTDKTCDETSNTPKIVYFCSIYSLTHSDHHQRQSLIDKNENCFWSTYSSHIHTCVRISEATFTQDEDEYLILYYLNNNNNNIERI